MGKHIDFERVWLAGELGIRQHLCVQVLAEMWRNEAASDLGSLRSRAEWGLRPTGESQGTTQDLRRLRTQRFRFWQGDFIRINGRKIE